MGVSGNRGEVPLGDLQQQTLPFLAGHGAEELGGLQQQGVHIHGLTGNGPGSGVAPGQGEQVVYQPGHAGAFHLDVLPEPGRLVGGHGQGGGAGTDDGQGRAELMGGGGDEFGLFPSALLDGTDGPTGKGPAEQEQSGHPGGHQSGEGAAQQQKLLVGGGHILEQDQALPALRRRDLGDGGQISLAQVSAYLKNGGGGGVDEGERRAVRLHAKGAGAGDCTLQQQGAGGPGRPGAGEAEGRALVPQGDDEPLSGLQLGEPGRADHPIRSELGYDGVGAGEKPCL